MKESIKVGRRDFTLASALAMLSGAVITVSSCGGGGDGGDSPTAPSPTPTPPPGSVSGSISANHGHTALITGAQLDAGDSVMLQLAGSAQHTHSVQLTAAEVEAIDAGQRISKTTSIDAGPVYASHSHVVIFN